ncbi:unnamed protein product [Dicrocoelium dendriticum]|nr:unnamed protein product [Dicrocoelium dendriticum]
MDMLESSIGQRKGSRNSNRVAMYLAILTSNTMFHLLLDSSAHARPGVTIRDQINSGADTRMRSSMQVIKHNSPKLLQNEWSRLSVNPRVRVENRQLRKFNRAI